MGRLTLAPNALLLCAVGLCQCTSSPQAVVTIPYRQDFQSGALGPEWSSRSAGWSVQDGRLFNDGAHNVPLWLLADLPDNVRISFNAESQDEAVDLKFELFGDGRAHASGYIVILSGWDNTKSIIARLDEHGKERMPPATQMLKNEVAKDAAAAAKRYRNNREVVARPHRGMPNHVYRFRCERRGPDIDLYVDDVLHLSFFDPSPLLGPGHNRFAFNNWASKVFFDDLVIESL